jgi:hypothetical protein
MALSYLHQVLCALFGAWFVMSIFFQVPRYSLKMSRYDPLGLLPKWTFFAPNPGIHDYHIVRRIAANAFESSEAPAPHEVASWQNIRPLGDTQSIPFLWNPDRRIKKTLSDATNSIISVLRRSKNGGDFVPYTPAYFLITHLAQRDAVPGTRVEWAIVRSHGFVGDRAVSPVFVSNLPLPDVCAPSCPKHHGSLTIWIGSAARTEEA